MIWPVFVSHWNNIVQVHTYSFNSINTKTLQLTLKAKCWFYYCPEYCSGLFSGRPNLALNRFLHRLSVDFTRRPAFLYCCPGMIFCHSAKWRVPLTYLCCRGRGWGRGGGRAGPCISFCLAQVYTSSYFPGICFTVESGKRQCLWAAQEENAMGHLSSAPVSRQTSAAPPLPSDSLGLCLLSPPPLLPGPEKIDKWAERFIGPWV